MAKVHTDNVSDGVRYRVTEAGASVDIVLSPKRKNRWFGVAHYDAGTGEPVRTLANATVLDPGDGRQRKTFLAGVPADVPAELVEQLLLYAAEHIGADTRGWQDWQEDQLARQIAETLAKAEAERVTLRAAHLGDLESDARQRLSDPKLLFTIGEAITARGLVGERQNALTLELAAVSRVTDEPICMVVKGDSAGGKSHQVRAVLAFHPDNAHVDLTSMSEKGLIYDTRDYAHRVLSFYEMDGEAANPFAAYLLRTLISEGRIEHLTVETSGPVPAGTVITKEGPIGFVSTTIEPALERQQETRTLSLMADDSEDQTRRVLEHQARHAQQGTPLPDATPWRDAHEWLAETGLRAVAIPFAGRLPEHMPTGRVRVRRDFPRLLGLIGACALLHQVQRERTEDGRVVATLADYAMVREVAMAAIGRSMQGLNTKTLELVERVAALYADKCQAATTQGADTATISVSYTDVVKATRLAKYTISRWLQPAIQLGVLDNRTEGQSGKTAQIVPGAYAIGDRLNLPTPESVAQPDDGLVIWFSPLDGTRHTVQCNASSAATDFQSQIQSVAALREEAAEEYFSSAPSNGGRDAKNIVPLSRLQRCNAPFLRLTPDKALQSRMVRTPGPSARPSIGSCSSDRKRSNAPLRLAPRCAPAAACLRTRSWGR
jgi:hypothetical protein